MKEQDLIKSMENVKLGDDAQKAILQKVLSRKNDKERVKMSKKKIIAIAAAATLVLGIAAFAASGKIAIWSSSGTEYNEIPDNKTIMKDIGYLPKVPESFSNGYTVSEASKINNTFHDENGNSVEKFKSIMLFYTKDGDRLSYSANKFSSDYEEHGEVIGTVNGIELRYTSYTGKSVPPNYKMTEEDKKAEESGELVFSYGASEVSINHVQGLVWVQDDIQYAFTQINGKLSPEELVKMAEEVINQAYVQ